MFSGVVSHFLKILINRPRPTKDLVRIIENARHQSFPSGHVLFYIIFFGFMIVLLYHLKLFSRRIRIALISFCSVMILAIPFSRIYLGAHWFTDVLASVFLGIIFLFILSYFYLQASVTRHEAN
ncbi:phosphatase PAP2 family protein [Daejeonella lutea]|uniref:phosphatase PAP2 family protein n=1 Tax=Daejeonella lutea TaxID=572036 RepID=UPI0009A82AE8